MDNLTVIVLAAGGGTRMKSKTMKVLHPIGGRSMIGHVLHAVQAVEPTSVVAVVGHQREQVGPHITELLPSAVLAVQETQEGTGHAVRVAMEACGTTTGTVIVAAGDTPLLEGESLRAFADGAPGRPARGEHPERPAGRPLRLRPDRPQRTRVTSRRSWRRRTRRPSSARSTRSAPGSWPSTRSSSSRRWPRITNDNAKGEYYLTDAVGLAREDGLTVGAHLIDDVAQTEGANDRAQLAELGRELNRRIVTRWMKDGVTVMDPATTWIEADVVLEPDATILPGTQLLGATVVREDAVVGPDTTLKDCEVGAGARVVRTHGELAVIGDRATVGPFAYLRPGTQLGVGGKIGTFVETKNSTIGDGAKVPHLSYVGDAEIGEGTNIGAGTIFANYDGVAKHRTVIGRHAKTGSNNTFVAPVDVGDGAGTAGGTVVRRNVPAGALAVSSSAAAQPRGLDGVEAAGHGAGRGRANGA